jgi:hypothetical protein
MNQYHRERLADVSCNYIDEAKSEKPRGSCEKSE